MSKSAFSLRVFSIYMIVLGAQLIVAPNMLLSMFGFPNTDEVWIRVVGMLVLIIGYFDLMASRSETLAFYRWSVHVRLVVPIFFIAFVLLGFAPPILLLFGIVDAAGAIWTAACLRKDGAPTHGIHSARTE